MPASGDENGYNFNEDENKFDGVLDISNDSNIHITQGAEVIICSGSMVVLKQNTNIFINSGGKLQIKKCEGSDIATIFVKNGHSVFGFVIHGKDSQLVAAHTIFCEWKQRYATNRW